MKLVITPLPTSTPKYSNAYFVECKSVTIRGDENVTVFGPFSKGEDEDDLANLLAVLTRLERAFPDGMFHHDGFENIEGFVGWFDPDHPNENSLYDTYSELEEDWEDYSQVSKLAIRYGGKRDNWPMEPLSNWETHAGYGGFEVTFYDENGIERSTTVEFEE